MQEWGASPCVLPFLDQNICRRGKTERQKESEGIEFLMVMMMMIILNSFFSNFFSRQGFFGALFPPSSLMIFFFPVLRRGRGRVERAGRFEIRSYQSTYTIVTSKMKGFPWLLFLPVLETDRLVSCLFCFSHWGLGGANQEAGKKNAWANGNRKVGGGSCLYSRHSYWSTCWDLVMWLCRHMDYLQSGPRRGGISSVLYIYFPFRQCFLEEKTLSLFDKPPSPKRGSEGKRKREEGFSRNERNPTLLLIQTCLHPPGIHLLVCSPLSPKKHPNSFHSHNIHTHAIVTLQKGKLRCRGINFFHFLCEICLLRRED